MDPEQIRQLADHAARTAVDADRAIDAWLAAGPAQTRTAELSAFHALNIADDAARCLRRAMTIQLISTLTA
jgi:hypothetical protein